MEFWDSYELLGTVKKNANTEVRIAKASKGSSSGVDIRTFFEIDGKYLGTKKGIFISADNIVEIANILNKTLQGAN